MRDKKIISLEELAKIVDELKLREKKVVLCHGVFDLLHVGHIRHFEAAKKFGDVLIVTLTEDKYVRKGPHRPAFSERLRCEAIASLECVDYVAINKWPTAVETIKLLKPDFYAKGIDYSKFSDDYTGGIIKEKNAIEDLGGKIIFTDEITFSSSSLINRYLHIFPETTDKYLINFANKYKPETIIDYIEKIYNLNILVIGEGIIDEYQYGYPLGMAGKEAMIALKYLKTEKFAGGTFVISNHLANFCNNVTLFTLLGDTETQEDFISQRLNKKINKIFYYKKNSPTIVKRRFLTMNPLTKYLTKLLEYYVFNELPLDKEQTKEIRDSLKEILPRYDVVLVADFGHGFINKELINTLIENSKFIAVNTQTNAGNRGYNTISKYPRADYICIDDPEIRYDARDKYTDLETLISDLSKKLHCDNIIITLGTRGCIVWSNNNCENIPSFSEKVIDTMGAGDAFLTITSALAANKVPIDVVGFVGNAIGALKCQIIGNEPIDKASLYKYITSLLR